MSDMPKFVHINEEGPREGFQIEKGPISTTQKIELIDALSETGITHIQAVSFVNPKRVPGWADADEVVEGFTAKPGVKYTALVLNDKGLERAVASDKLHVRGTISLTASEKFLMRNQRRTLAENIEAQRGMISLFKQHEVDVNRVSVMAAFGCNFEGNIAASQVLDMVRSGMTLANDSGLNIKEIGLADTMGWATPQDIYRTVGAVRDAYPDHEVVLHLHDTRGMAVANALAGLQLGVAKYDATVGGLGGCPFAANAGASGNICTEDLVFMLGEMGIETGIDLDKLIEVAKLAEDIVGHPLPGSVKVGGNLRTPREQVNAA